MGSVLPVFSLAGVVVSQRRLECVSIIELVAQLLQFDFGHVSDVTLLRKPTAEPAVGVLDRAFLPG